jgi:histone H3/H4
MTARPASHLVSGEDDIEAVKRHRAGQHLQANVHKTVTQIAEHELTTGQIGAPVSRGAVAAVTELTTHLLLSVVADSIAFANHAGRRNVSERDVLLCSRRTDDNHSNLKTYLDSLDDARAALHLDAPPPKKRSKKPRPTVVLPETTE